MTMTAPETGPAPLTLTLFGPFRALVAGQPLPRLHSQKALWLLALLALRSGRPVEREWLASTLWPDANQDQAFANLRPVLSDLRRALGVEGIRLQSPSRHALLLDTTGAEVDVLDFDAAVARKTPEALAQVAALYLGPLLEGCAEEWAPQERRAREEDCLSALQTLAAAALATGDFRAAAEYFRQAVALDPWREAAQRGLMDALARTGDINAALQVYREFAELLRSDPKAVPDAETSALYARLRAETRRKAAAPSLVSPDALAPVVTGYLPHPLTNLIGREDERLEVAAKLRRSRLVTLTGPGGVGKTRLALAIGNDVASEFADGVWLVSLEALTAEARLEGHIAGLLGLKEEAGQSWRDSLTRHLRTKRLLLVLDNCEHLHAACAQVAGHLLQECARVRVLATSREALGIIGETAWAVPPLTVPHLAYLPMSGATLVRVLAGYESVQLFIERAQAVQTSFELTAENTLVVAQVCVRLEGIPLAIELAAARVKAMTVAQIASRLDDHLDLLTGNSRAGPSRQQTLRATLDWSYDLLSQPERLLLARLSLFAGGWILDAAEAVCAGAGLEVPQVLDLLLGLVDQSLVVFESRAPGGRYRLLETIRQYAAERLGSVPETEGFRTRHAAWAVALALEAKPQLSSPEQGQWLERLETEHNNLRAAIAWTAVDPAGAEAGLHLTEALSHFWRMRGYFSEGLSHLRQALRHAGTQTDTNVRAAALNGIAMLHYMQGDYVEARAMCEQSLIIFRTLEDRKGIASSLNSLGNATYGLGEYAAARAAYEESLNIAREMGDWTTVAGTLHNLGATAHAQGDLARSWTLYEESLGILRKKNDSFRISSSLHNLGNLAYSQKNYALARSLYEEGLPIAREQGSKENISFFLEDFGDVDYSEGEYASAKALYEESLSLRRDLGDKRGIASSLQNLAKVSYFLLGDAALAKTLYRQSFEIFRDLKYQEGIARGLKGLASVMPDQGHSAARLWGAAESLREKISAQVLPNELETYERQVGEVRAALGEATFAAAWQEGRSRPWEQILANVLPPTE